MFYIESIQQIGQFSIFEILCHCSQLEPVINLQVNIAFTLKRYNGAWRPKLHKIAR
jgi:hypothetical protein